MCRLLLLLCLTLTAAAGCQQQPAVTPVPAAVLCRPAVAATPPAQTPPGGIVPRGWVPQVRLHAWHYIVIHHSATTRGSAAIFDAHHRRRGWDGLGYHFVIGNGTDTPDGLIEVGPRWTMQKHGAHAGVDLYNQQGIGICLVGNMNLRQPSAAQTNALTQLISYLMAAHNIPANWVLGHRDVKRTDCPGRYVDVVQIRRLAAERMVQWQARR